MRFRAAQHLRRQDDIRAVREQGRRIDCRVFTLWWKRRETAALGGESPNPSPRVCVIASYKGVGIAVQRNRAKRRLREVFRLHQQAVPVGCDLLLIARAAATNCPLPELEQKFVEACQRIGPAVSTEAR